MIGPGPGRNVAIDAWSLVDGSSVVYRQDAESVWYDLGGLHGREVYAIQMSVTRLHLRSSDAEAEFIEGHLNKCSIVRDGFAEGSAWQSHFRCASVTLIAV